MELKQRLRTAEDDFWLLKNAEEAGLCVDARLRIEALEGALREIASFDYEHDDTEMQIHCAEIARSILSNKGDSDVD